MKAITNFGKSGFSRVMGVKKPAGCGQKVEDKQVEREQMGTLLSRCRPDILLQELWEGEQRDQAVIGEKQEAEAVFFLTYKKLENIEMLLTKKRRKE